MRSCTTVVRLVAAGVYIVAFRAECYNLWFCCCLGRESIVVTNVTAVFTADRFVHVELKAERCVSPLRGKMCPRLAS